MERVLVKILEESGTSRSETIAMEIEENWKKAERMNRVGNNGWHSRKIFKEMKEGRISFWGVREAYLAHELNRYQLEEIVKEGLKETGGSLKGLLPIFRIEKREYKKFLNFLHAQDIKLKSLRNSDQSQNSSDYSQKK